MNSYSMNDQLLIDLLYEQDQEAFSFLYESYSPSLHGRIIEIVANKELAAEILQEAFVQVYHTIGSYDRSKGKIFTWMLNISTRICHEIMRSMKSWPTPDQLSLFAGRYGKWIQQLEDGPKQVIELIYYKGYTKYQVADALNISLETVLVLHRKGILKLTAQIKSL
jgi:RNA polymerase sigma-70 factor (ECF subfamily)